MDRIEKLYARLEGKAKESFDEWYLSYRNHQIDLIGYDVLPVDINNILLGLTVRTLILEWLDSVGFQYTFKHMGGRVYQIHLTDYNFKTGMGQPNVVYHDLIVKCVQLFNEGKTQIDRKCIVCENTIPQLIDSSLVNEYLGGGTSDKFSMGYGSSKDLQSYEFYICDDCVDIKEKKGIIKRLR